MKYRSIKVESITRFSVSGLICHYVTTAAQLCIAVIRSMLHMKTNAGFEKKLISRRKLVRETRDAPNVH